MVGLRTSVVSLSRVAAAFLLVAAFSSCAGRSVGDEAEPCTEDAECGANERCALPIDRPAAGLDVCGRYDRCGAEGECPAGLVCAPPWQAFPNYEYCADDRCVEACTEDSCPDGSECGGDGVCVLTSCATEGAEPCPEHWTCSPEAAQGSNPERAYGTPIETSNIEFHKQRGCIRLRCDQPGGLVCSPLWTCAPAGTHNPAGCVADPCAETGQCPDPSMICVTESRHPERVQRDAHDCVARLCDEGHSCSSLTEAGVDVGVCDFSLPDADYYGCSLRDCTSDADCFYDYVCDASSRQADPQGCRNRSCTEGYLCPQGFVCDPNASQRDAADCTTPEFASSGGSGGTGGTGGVGGSTTPPRGQCVAR